MNWQSWLIVAVLAVILIAIIVNFVLNKKKGKSSCSCGCGGCAFKDTCHKEK
ncbi:MAG: FeoB-associated Cys-rich membrane protein [Clostridia bacterium]|nr:FeoB-associated Cys-rich membrane protein [Clostridia bacterium]